MKKIFYFLWIGAFVFLFAQMPVFVDEYTMRLEGHLSEAFRQVRLYEEAASRCHLSVTDYVEVFYANGDSRVRQEGRVIEKVLERAHLLEQAYKGLSDSNPYLRPVRLLFNCDHEIVAETWAGFVPGLLLSGPIFVWGLIGALFSLLVRLAFGRCVRGFRKKSI